MARPKSRRRSEGPGVAAPQAHCGDTKQQIRDSKLDSQRDALRRVERDEHLMGLYEGGVGVMLLLTLCFSALLQAAVACWTVRRICDVSILRNAIHQAAASLRFGV